MAYEKQNWTTKTPITPEALNHMENGISENNTDILNLKEKLNNLIEEELFSNSSGETGNITLNEDISNFEYVEITCGENKDFMVTQKIPVIDEKITDATLFTNHPNFNSSFMLQFSKVFSIAGTNLTVIRSLKVDSNNRLDTSNENLKIYKIIGIKTQNS